jgi:hypothetical protein
MDAPKTERNRVHLGMNASEGPHTPIQERKKFRAEVDRLLQLGATEQAEWEERWIWVVMLDPEENEFCVQ